MFLHNLESKCVCSMFLMDKIKPRPTFFFFLSSKMRHIMEVNWVANAFFHVDSKLDRTSNTGTYLELTVYKEFTHILPQTNWVNGPEGLCSRSACCYWVFSLLPCPGAWLPMLLSQIENERITLLWQLIFPHYS